MVDREMLEHNYQTATYSDPDVSRLEYLADHIFDFTTYDSAISELFARKALEVCAAISRRQTFEYIKDEDNHRWFLLMVNMPFFVGRLNWGTSIRGAWWDLGEQKLESCGLWRGDEQVLTVEFSEEGWALFIDALIDFGSSAAHGVALPAPTHQWVQRCRHPGACIKPQCGDFCYDAEPIAGVAATAKTADGTRNGDTK